MDKTVHAEHPASLGRSLSTPGRVLAAVAGLCAIGLAVYGAVSTAPPSADYETFGGNAREIAFLVYLLASTGAMGATRRADIASRRAMRLINVGYGLVAVGVMAGMILREDPDWFAAVGIPGNLLAMAGWISFGIASARTHRLPRWLATLAAIGGVFAVLFADFGSGVLIGWFWLSMAHRENDADQ